LRHCPLMVGVAAAKQSPQKARVNEYVSRHSP
jgi:hypothetical protein